MPYTWHYAIKTSPYGPPLLRYHVVIYRFTICLGLRRSLGNFVIIIITQGTQKAKCTKPRGAKNGSSGKTTVVCVVVGDNRGHSV